MNQGALIVKKSVKQKIVFALLLGMITTGLVSFTLILKNIGFTETFWQTWLKSWLLDFLVIVPVILTVSPVVERFVGFLFKKGATFE